MALDLSGQVKYEDIIKRVHDLMQQEHREDFAEVRSYYDTPKESYPQEAYPLCAMALERDVYKDVGVRKRDHDATFDLIIILQSFQRDNNAIVLYQLSRKLTAMLDANPHLILGDGGLVRRAWPGSVEIGLKQAGLVDVLTMKMRATWIQILPMPGS